MGLPSVCAQRPPESVTAVQAARANEIASITVERRLSVHAPVARTRDAERRWLATHQMYLLSSTDRKGRQLQMDFVGRLESFRRHWRMVEGLVPEVNNHPNPPPFASDGPCGLTWVLVPALTL